MSHIPTMFLIIATFLYFCTELLSFVSLLQPSWLRLAWAIFAVCLVYAMYRRRLLFPFPVFRFRPVHILILIIPCLTLIQGLVSPPNTTDAMVYHLPRMLYWAQESTAHQDAVFTAHDYMPPMSGYIFTNIYLLVGTDRFLFLAQWLAGIVTLSVSYLMCLAFTQDKEKALWGCAFLASLPMLAFQMSSTQVDLISTAYVTCTYWFALKLTKEYSAADTIFMGLSTGFAVITKPNTFLWVLGPWFLYLYEALKDKKMHSIVSLSAALVLGAGMQARWLEQNLRLYGSLLGRHLTTDGELHYTNDVFSPAIAIANMVRNILLQLPIPFFGGAVELSLEKMMLSIGTSLYDSASTWYGSVFRVQSIIFPQEDIVSSPIHMLVLLAVTMLLLWREDKTWPSFQLLALWTGLLLFSLIFRWQPYHSRLLLPFLAVGSMLSWSFVPLSRYSKWLVIASLALSTTLVLANVSRPFISYTLVAEKIKPFMPVHARVPTSISHTPREKQYFHARQEWQEAYVVMSEQLHASESLRFELHDGFLYPLMRLVKMSAPDVAFSQSESSDTMWSGSTVSTPSGSLCIPSLSANSICLRRAHED